MMLMVLRRQEMVRKVKKVVVRRGNVAPGSRGCLCLAPFALDGL